MNETTFSKNLKYYRKKSKLSRKQIAEKLDMLPSSYGFYETGRTTPDVDKLQTIAELLQVSIDVLVGFQLDDFHSCQNFWQNNHHSIVVNADGSIEMTLPVYGVNKSDSSQGITFVDGYARIIRFRDKQVFIDFTKEIQRDSHSKISAIFSDFAYSLYKNIKDNETSRSDITAIDVPFNKTFIFEQNFQ